MDKCLECGNEMFSDDGFDVTDLEQDGDEIWQRYTCNKCGFQWNVVYKFAFYENADTGEIISSDELLDK